MDNYEEQRLELVAKSPGPGGNATNGRKARRQLLPEWIDPRHAVFILLVFIILVIFITHIGINSPWTYIRTVVEPENKISTTIEGMHANPDAVYGYWVTTGIFYQPVKNPGDYARNPAFDLALPLFFDSIVTGLTRSYTLSCYIVNILFMFLLAWALIVLSSKFEIPWPSVALSGAVLILLPVFSHYIGQPMHYIPSVAASFLIVIAVMLFALRDYRNPWGLGLLTGLVMINYDWYVFLGALILFFLIFHRFRKPVHYVYFFISVIAPFFIWYSFTLVVRNMTGSTPGFSVVRLFIIPVLKGWLNFLAHPFSRFSLPLNATDIGLEVAFKQIVGYIYWPLLLFTLYFLIKLLVNRRNGEKEGSPVARIAVLLLTVYVSEQLIVAMFDWENQTRRAIPLILVFAVAFVFVVWKTMDRRWVRYVLVALLIMCIFFNFADILFKDPGIQATQSAEFIKWGPKDSTRIAVINDRRLTKESLPILEKDRGLELFQVPRASLSAGNVWVFLFPQIFLFACALILFFFIYRAGIFSIHYLWIFSAIFILSITIRFI